MKKNPHNIGSVHQHAVYYSNIRRTWVLTWVDMSTYLGWHEYLLGFKWVHARVYMGTYLGLHEYLLGFTWVLARVYMGTYLGLHEYLLGFTWVLTWVNMSTYLGLNEYMLGFTWVLTWVHMSTCSGLHGYLLGFTWVLARVYMGTCSGLHEYLLGFTWVLARVYMGTYLGCCTLLRPARRDNPRSWTFRSHFPPDSWPFSDGECGTNCIPSLLFGGGDSRCKPHSFPLYTRIYTPVLIIPWACIWLNQCQAVLFQ